MTDESTINSFPPPKSFLVTMRVVVGQEDIFHAKGEEDYDADGPWEEDDFIEAELCWAGESFSGLKVLAIKEEGSANGLD